MAAGMGQIRRAVMDRLGQIPDVTPYAFVPDAVETPAVFIEPAASFVDYTQGYGRPNWKFVITVLVNRIDEDTAQDALDDYIDPDGPIVAILARTDIDDSLNAVASIEPLSAGRYGSYRVGNTTYLGAQISISAQI
jgi:hypothetical protein